MIRPFLIGFATTFKHMFKKPNTVNYPDEKVPMFPKYRGKQVLMRDENGLEKCVACGLCAVACPADAIYLEAGGERRHRPGRSALRVDLPDSQDALHLLRLLRRGVPGVGDLHGQGLRAGRLQQQGLHLGQAGPARPGAATPTAARSPQVRRVVAAVDRDPDAGRSSTRSTARARLRRRDGHDAVRHAASFSTAASTS